MKKVKILLPILFDSTSEHAFFQAYHIAMASNAELHVLGIYDPGSRIRTGSENVRTHWKDRLEAYVRAKLLRFTTVYPNVHPESEQKVDIKYHIGQKPIWRSIQKISASEHTDLIAWLFRSFKPIIELFTGETDITGLLEHLKGSILVLPEKHPFESINKLVYAGTLHLEEEAQVQYLAELKTLIKAKTLEGVKIVVDSGRSVHIGSDLLKNKFRRMGLDDFHMIENPSVLEGLRESIENPDSEV